MAEHVGKKRRKEVREAVNMRKQLVNGMAVMVALLLLGILVSVGLTFSLALAEQSAGNIVAQSLPTVVLFVFVVYLGTRSYKWSGLKKRYDDHRKRYNITKQDMKDLQDGRL